MTLSYGISGFAPGVAEGRITLQGATSFAIISRFLRRLLLCKEKQGMIK
jgi:hypothetical protein